MPISITFTWNSSRPDTIWKKLAAQLRREPTHAEAVKEVCRILREARAEREADGR